MAEIRAAAKKRIYEEYGASIVLSLFTFLVVTMISTVIVSAALTNVMRVRRQRLQEQAFLNVDSASKLLQSMILADAEHERAIMVKIKDPDLASREVYYVGLPDDSQTGNDAMFDAFESILKDWVKTEEEYIYDAANPSALPQYSPVTVDFNVQAGGELAESLSSTGMTVTMKKCEREVMSEPNYDFTITLSYQDLGYDREITFRASAPQSNFKFTSGEMPSGEDWHYIQWIRVETKRLQSDGSGASGGENG